MVRVQNKSILRRKEGLTMPQIRLYNSDCIEAMKNIKDHTIDLIVTDPPYNLGNFMKNRDTNLSKMRDNFLVPQDGTIWSSKNGKNQWTHSLSHLLE